MKKLLFALTVTVLFSCATGNNEQYENAEMTLDWAIADFSVYLSARLFLDGTVAVLNIAAPLRALSDYVSDELLSRIHNDGMVKVMSRQDLETLKQEQNIQLEGDVSDETSVRIGHISGWQTVITGSVTPLDNGYRLAFRAVDVESGELRGTRNYIIQPDPVLSSIVNPSLTVAALSQREEILKPFDGRTNAFELRLWPKEDKSVYYDGEEMFINIQAGQDCYFVVYQVDVDNKMQLIYPNDYDQDNSLKATVTRVIPESSSFIFHAPYGEERILVYASEKPITIPADQYSPRTITPEYLSNPNALWQTAPNSGAKGMSVVPRGATGQFSYTILPGN
ncbi:DUF4384 domain-containing protein [Breznakiellaceae bacterium SP9]